MYVHNKASNNALFKTYIERVFKDNLSNHLIFWYLIVVVIYLHITLQVAGSSLQSFKFTTGSDKSAAENIE